jgi:DNA-binding transcriptional regulator YiaG
MTERIEVEGMTDTKPTTFRELRASTGMTQQAFSVRFGIPKRTIENWDSGISTPPTYVIGMMIEILNREREKCKE